MADRELLPIGALVEVTRGQWRGRLGQVADYRDPPTVTIGKPGERYGVQIDGPVPLVFARDYLELVAPSLVQAARTVAAAIVQGAFDA